jgi:hypothetical protein
MDAAEHLVAQVDPVDPALANPVDRRSSRTIDSGQPEYPRLGVERLPCQIGGGAPASAPAADRRALVDPGAAGVAIDPGRRQIADPACIALREHRRMADEHRIVFAGGRHRGKNMGRGGNVAGNRHFVIDRRPIDPCDPPAPRFECDGNARGRITRTEDEQRRHRPRV